MKEVDSDFLLFGELNAIVDVITGCERTAKGRPPTRMGSARVPAAETYIACGRTGEENAHQDSD